MKKIFTLFLCVIAALGTLQAAEITYDFSQGVPSSWTSSVNPFGVETASLARGTQYTASATLTLKDVKQATKVVITCSTNVDKKNTLGVKVGGTTFGKDELLGKANDVELTYEGAATDGDLVITMTHAEKSIYIKKVVVTCGEATGSGNNGGGSEGKDDDQPQLDPSYKYDEPTTITVSGASGSNTAYSFVQKNILVNCTTGAQNDNYFGCNAGSTITFTATQEIKAVVIDGFIKKDFTATVDNGTIQYADASASDIEASPAVIVKGVNAKSVAITCAKQMRCYNVEFYFTTEPDVELGEGGDDDDDDDDWLEELLKPTYESEPTAKTTINLTLTQGMYANGEYEDGTPYTQFALSDETNAVLIAIIGEVKTGTYTINDSEEPGTALASAGGNLFADYPSYIGLNYNEEDEYYESVYYLVSGTITVTKTGDALKIVINAKSYNGSTITVTYTGTPEEFIDDDDDDDDYDSELSYDWETTEVSTQNFTFDYAESASGHDDEYDYDWTQIYLEGEDWTSDLFFFAPYAEGTGVAPGTYTISTSEEDGTVYASPGGDDSYDYPSNICYNYDENGYYSDVYYLVSGTVKVTKTATGVKIEINAKSYNGSTINGTFTGSIVNTTAIENISAESKSSKDGKIMQNGKIYIQRNGQRYNASGLLVK